MCQGQDPEPVQTNVAPPRSIGHGKVMPPDTRDKAVILTYLLHMSEKVAARLRRHTLAASRFLIALRTRDGWIGDKPCTAQPIDDGALIMALCYRMLQQHWRGQGVHQVQVTALDPLPARQQGDLFAVPSERCSERNAVMDDINRRFGEFTLAPARLLQRSSMPNVIAPAWKPYGHRQTV